MSNFSSSGISIGIVNNDQGFYQNTGKPGVTNLPEIYLAFLSNVSNINLEESDVIINLNPICLNWCDFTTLFFRSPSGVFWINPSNATSKLLVFSNQTYESTQSKCVQFSLTDQIKKAWSKQNSKSEVNIPANINILLNRAGFLTKSVAYVKEYVQGLSIDEAISALLSSNEIVPGNSETSATVKFIISYKDYFAPLNTSIVVNFSYVTKIPCYKNNIDCFIECNAYSKNCDDCRVSIYENNSEVHSLKKSNFEIYETEDDIASQPSLQSKSINAESVDSSLIIGELTKIINSEASTKMNNSITFGGNDKTSLDDATENSSRW